MGLIFNPILALIGTIGALVYMMLKAVGNMGSGDGLSMTGGIVAATSAVKDIKKAMDDMDEGADKAVNGDESRAAQSDKEIKKANKATKKAEARAAKLQAILDEQSSETTTEFGK